MLFWLFHSHVTKLFSGSLAVWLLAAAAEAPAEADPDTNLLLASGLLVICVGLFLLEFFVPSFGLISVTATICALGSVYLAFQAGNVPGIVFLVLNIVAIPTVVMMGFKLMRRSPMVLEAVMSTPDVSGEQARRLQALTGRQGRAATYLRPAGTARIDNVSLSVQTRGEFIPKGTFVEVLFVEGNRIYVRAVPE